MNGQIKLTSNSMATQTQPIHAESLVTQVSTKEIIYHGTGKYQILLVDFGVKQNIIRSLLNFNVTVKQVPFDYDYSHEQCDGILLSNGPGDPKDCSQSIAILKAALKNNIPTFGICLGSQLLGLAAGADTYKLKFGHRGQNQPVQDTQSLRCYLSSQNHGYALCHNSLPNDWQITFTHLHDNSIAGIKHKSKPYSAVQFHPEAAAGPHDTAFLFNDFIQQVMMGASQK
jgi:carbamoyl-phosphate synthase small subunit